MAKGHELEELVVGGMAVIELACKRFADGFQAEDIPAIMTSLGEEKVFQDAVTGVQDIAREIREDLGVLDYLQMGGKVVMYVPKIVGIFLAK